MCCCNQVEAEPGTTITVKVDGVKVDFDQSPEVINQCVMVPMGPIFDVMGATLSWDGDSQTATAIKGSIKVVTQVGNYRAYVNDVPQALSVAPVAMGGRVLAPLRFVAESLGYIAEWDESTKTADITFDNEGMLDHSTSNSQPEDSYIPNSLTGQTVYFGNYEQDNNTANGPEAIAWKVLEVKNNKMLLIAEEGLDCMKYDETDTAITWEKSTLRQWLNRDFINAAFSIEEQERIAITMVQNPVNPIYGRDGGNDTQDRVFLLSIDEAKQYYINDPREQSAEAIAKEYSIPNVLRFLNATDYAVAQGVVLFNSQQAPLMQMNGNCCWWLRSSGAHDRVAAYIDVNGDIMEGGGFTVFYGLAVRPVMWVDK